MFWVFEKKSLSLVSRGERRVFDLFDLGKDPKESTDISKSRPEVFEKMKAYFIDWNKTVDASVAGKDYPEGRVNGGEPESGFWMVDERYEPFLEDWKIRPEYKGRFKK